MRQGPSMFERVQCASRYAVAALLLSAATAGLAQATAAANGGPVPSRVEAYVGYAYFHPFSGAIGPYSYPPLPQGSVGSLTGYFNRHLGFQVEGTGLPNSSDDNDCVYTVQAGPVLRYPAGRFVPFVHALGGAAEVGGPAGQKCSVWGWGATGGLGIDYVLPFFHDRLALRPVQADFMYSRIDNGPLVLPARTTGGLGEIYAYRLSGGVVFRFGSIGGIAQAPTLTCMANPTEAYPGDPVTVSANALNVRVYKDQRYLWTSSAGPISGTDATQTIATANLTPGSYTAAASMVEGKKARQIATCTADFKVLDTEPPTISCAANRSSINSGDQVVITSTARSPQNLGMTYSYATSTGLIAGDTATATLSTAGAAPGAITVTCKVVDAKGKTASATTSVVVASPPPPPAAAEARSLCGVSFDRDRARPNRVDNEAKGCLDDIALSMNREVGSKLLIVGNHAPGESAQNSGARALNVSEYLIKEKGIDASRLELRIGDEPSRTVTDTLVPPGAVFDPGTSQAFDPASIRRQGQAYGTIGAPARAPRRARRKSAAVKKPASSDLLP